jgi:hypothetical protein
MSAFGFRESHFALVRASFHIVQKSFLVSVNMLFAPSVGTLPQL